MMSFAATSAAAKGHQTEVRKVAILDSLRKGDALGKLIKRTYKGTITFDHSPRKQRCTLTIYNYEHSGDGVFEMVIRAGRIPKKLQGRMYTLRGDAQDQDATVYQFILFSAGKSSTVEPINFLYLGNKLESLDRNFNRKKEFVFIRY